ncbi:MAG: hypothetical protein KBB83_06175 [Alphaproteobacteria bacterium]|nr:hypothetical protein [Alphaproteobacteria bacterium]
MLSFTKKIIIIANFVAIYSGQFMAIASDDETQQDEGVEAKSAPNINLLPAIPQKDIQNKLTVLMRDELNPLRLAQLSKAWHLFVLGRAFEKKEKGIAIPFSPNSPAARWLEQRDAEILDMAIFRLYPEGLNPIDIKLSTMNKTNGDLLLPTNLCWTPLCLTRNVETFVNPKDLHTSSNIFLLLTLNELKCVAQRLSTDALFLQTVSEADLSQKALCVLIRHGGDNLEEKGFEYNILKFADMHKCIWIDCNEYLNDDAAPDWCLIWPNVRILFSKPINTHVHNTRADSWKYTLFQTF